MTRLDRKQVTRLLDRKDLTADNLAFLKRVLWQDSVFVMARELGQKPHDLQHMIRGSRKPGPELVELICSKAFMKLMRRPTVVVQQN